MRRRPWQSKAAVVAILAILVQVMLPLLPLALEQALQLAAGVVLPVPLVRRPQEQAQKSSEQLWRSFLQRRSSIYSPICTCVIMRRPVLGVNN